MFGHEIIGIVQRSCSEVQAILLFYIYHVLDQDKLRTRGEKTKVMQGASVQKSKGHVEIAKFVFKIN